MQPRTAKFDTTVASSHRIAVTVDVLYNRLPVATGLAVTTGSVTLDRTAAVRGRCQLTFAEPLKIPTSTGGLLSPYGYEVQIKRGVSYPDGTTELMGLGVYPIQASQIDGVTLLTQIDGLDRAQLVADARFVDDYAIADGTNAATAIHDMIDAAVPGLTYVGFSTPYTVPASVFATLGDRWAAAQSIAAAIGCELYFGPAGQLVLRPEPTFSAIPAWSLVEGEGGLLTGASLRLDRGPAYNAVIATGENSGLATVPKGVWYDLDPSSPTYWFGGFGQKPRGYSSPFITSDAQALSAATAIGVAQQGVARSLSFEGVPNPALEPGDALLVTREALGVNEIHLTDVLTFGLGADAAMTGSSRMGLAA